MVYVDEKGTPFYKPAPAMHEPGTANGQGAIALGVAHDVLYKEISADYLEEHNQKLLLAMKDVTPNLCKAGFSVFFTEQTEKRSPIMIVDYKNKNKDIVNYLCHRNSVSDKSVFVREGAFCAYRVIEKLKPWFSSIIKCESTPTSAKQVGGESLGLNFLFCDIEKYRKTFHEKPFA